MTNIWEKTFAEKGLMWGKEPTLSALFARDCFVRAGVRDVLVPGIEISGSAIALARSELGLEIPIHHGPVSNMPFDDRQYDGIFCYGLIYLLDAGGRAKLIGDCWEQLSPGGTMIFTVISTDAPMYGQGPKLGDDWYEIHPGLPMYFYDADSVAREFGAHGLVEQSRVDEPLHNGSTFPFINAVCTKP